MSENAEHSRDRDTVPAPGAEMADVKLRWFAFLDSMEARMDGLGNEAMPELREAFRTDADPYRRGYHQLVSALNGQIAQLKIKARGVRIQKIDGLFSVLANGPSVTRDAVYAFRHTCNERENLFEARCRAWSERFAETGTEDFEIRYLEILNAYREIKDRFACHQCGSGLVIEKIFFVTAYVACASCGTQNVFEPGIQARQMEQIGRKLAEQRAAPMLLAYRAAQERERTLYFRIHGLKTDAVKNGGGEEVPDGLEAERLELIARTPELYASYLREMFDEWKKIVPDLAEENEKFYARMLSDFCRYGA